MSKLEKVGISKYINDFPIRHGRLKAECSDFVVQEMHRDGTCTDKPKLDVPAIARAQSLLVDLSARPGFEVYDRRVFQGVSSEKEIIEMYNMFPVSSVDGRGAGPGSEVPSPSGGDASVCARDVCTSVQSKCTVPSHLCPSEGSICIGAYACPDREARTAIHLALKSHPYVKTKTVEATIHFMFSKVNTYVFVVKKTNRDTASVASLLGKKIGNVSFAGNKDKKAITYQRMSANTDFMKLYSCDVMDIRRGPAIRIGELCGNSFVIRVRDLQVRGVRELRFLNYFGNQRFGKGLNNHEIGKHIIESRFDEALGLIIRTYSEHYENRDGSDLGGESSEGDSNAGGFVAEGSGATSHSKGHANCKETAHALYLGGKYWDAYYQIPPRFGIERHIMACRAKDLCPRLTVKSMRRESLMLYLHSYQSYLFNMGLNKRLERVLEGKHGDDTIETDDYVLENGKFVAATSAKLDDIWVKLQRLPHPMCKGGFRKMIEVANDFQTEIDGNDTVFRFWLRPCAFATMAVREFIGDNILP